MPKYNTSLIKVKCDSCNLVSEVEFRGYLGKLERNGRKFGYYFCIKCVYKSLTRTHEEYLNEIFNKYDCEYTIIGTYKTARIPIETKHNICNFVWKASPDGLLSDKKCPRCAKNFQYSTEDFKEIVFKLVGHEYVVLGEYIKTNTKILIKHIDCGHEWNIIPASFIRGTRCPKCNESKGEKRIRNYLEINSFNYQSQFRIDKCKNVTSFPFDFAVFDVDSTIRLLIEFDGQQHFLPTGYWGGDDKLLRTQKTDKIKNDFCTENLIPLLRIKYTDIKNIEKILDKFLWDFSSKKAREHRGFLIGENGGSR